MTPQGISLAEQLLARGEAQYTQQGLLANYSYLASNHQTIRDLTGNGYDLQVENIDPTYSGPGLKDIKAKAVKASPITNTCTIEILACEVANYNYSPTGLVYGLGGFTSNATVTNYTGATISGCGVTEPFSWRNLTLNGDSIMMPPTRTMPEFTSSSVRAIHLAGTVDVNDVRGFMNGWEIAKIQRSINFSGDRLFKLGVNVVANSSSQWGELNRFPYTFLAARVYDRALTQAEIIHNYAADDWNYNLGWNRKYIKPYYWTNVNLYNVTASSSNPSHPARNLYDWVPIVTDPAGSLTGSWVWANGGALPVTVQLTFPDTLFIRSLTLYQLANKDGGARDVQAFADAAMTDPIGPVVTMENCVTNAASIIPGDPAGSTAAFGAPTVIPINRKLNSITLKCTSRWGLYYGGFQEIDVDGYYAP